MIKIIKVVCFGALLAISGVIRAQEERFNNPIITDNYTADPAALVYQDSVYIYAGHDQAPNDRDQYEMHEWLVYSSADMVNWKEHPVPLKPTDFEWAKGLPGQLRLSKKMGNSIGMLL